MSIFNIPNIRLEDTFEAWFLKTNEIIEDLNTIVIVDAQADTDKGIYESYRNGGVVMFGVSPGSGIGFDTDGRLTLAFNGVTVGTRTGVDDIVLLINPLDGTIKGVSGTNILPSQVSNDINFTGDVSFSGDLNFISTGVVTLEVDTSFRDKLLEIAVNFDDSLDFATVGTSVPITTVAYFVDINVVGADFSGLNTSATGTYLGRGTVQATDLPSNSITLTDFVFSTTGDSFQEFTIAGATDGGRYALVDQTGITLGRGLLDHDAVKAPAARQTQPVVASGAGLAVLTRDPITPSGGSEGQKLFTWIWNGTSADAAWTSSENIQIYDDKALIAKNFYSPSDRFNKFSQATTIFETYAYGSGTTGFAFYYSQPSDIFSIGPFTATSTFTSSIQFNRNGTITAGTTGLASNLNADLLDGAHGATLGGTSNTIPVTGTDGRIDVSFLPFGAAIEEIISQTSHGLLAGTCVRKNSSGDFVGALANAEGTADAVGIVVEIIDVNTFRLRYFGIAEPDEVVLFDLALGYDDGGGTVGLNVGEVYYLSESITGGISDSKPSGASSITKPMFIALDTRKILITNFNSSPSPTGDTINVSSVVPVGSISYVADANISSNSDFIVCDGKVYNSTQYPDLKTAIQGQFYLEGFGTGGESTVIVLGEDSETRNFAVGQTFQIRYNEDNNLLGITVASVTPISTGVRIGFTPDVLAGSGYYDDIEIRGTGAYFVVPDLRSRGVVGTGDPDGTGTENELASGDVVGVGSDLVSDYFETFARISLQSPTTYPKTVISGIENGTWVFHGRFTNVTSGNEGSYTSRVTVNGVERTHFISNNPDGTEPITFPMIVEVTENKIEIDTSESMTAFNGSIGYKIGGA